MDRVCTRGYTRGCTGRLPVDVPVIYRSFTGLLLVLLLVLFLDLPVLYWSFSLIYRSFTGFLPVVYWILPFSTGFYRFLYIEVYYRFYPCFTGVLPQKRCHFLTAFLTFLSEMSEMLEMLLSPIWQFVSNPHTFYGFKALKSLILCPQIADLCLYRCQKCADFCMANHYR